MIKEELKKSRLDESANDIEIPIRRLISNFFENNKVMGTGKLMADYMIAGITTGLIDAMKEGYIDENFLQELGDEFDKEFSKDLQYRM